MQKMYHEVYVLPLRIQEEYKPPQYNFCQVLTMLFMKSVNCYGRFHMFTMLFILFLILKGQNYKYHCFLYKHIELFPKVDIDWTGFTPY